MVLGNASCDSEGSPGMVPKSHRLSAGNLLADASLKLTCSFPGLSPVAFGSRSPGFCLTYITRSRSWSTASQGHVVGS